MTWHCDVTLWLQCVTLWCDIVVIVRDIVTWHCGYSAWHFDMSVWHCDMTLWCDIVVTVHDIVMWHCDYSAWHCDVTLWLQCSVASLLPLSQCVVTGNVFGFYLLDVTVWFAAVVLKWWSLDPSDWSSTRATYLMSLSFIWSSCHLTSNYSKLTGIVTCHLTRWPDGTTRL